MDTQGFSSGKQVGQAGSGGTGRATGPDGMGTGESTGEGQGMVDQAQQKAGEMVDQVQQKAGDVVGRAQEQVSARLSDQIGRASETLGGVANAVSDVGKQLRDQGKAPLAGYADKAASQVDRLSGYLRGKDLDDIVEETEHFARREPAYFLGGAFAVGLLAARFLKSSSQRRGKMRREQIASRWNLVGDIRPDGGHPRTDLFEDGQMDQSSQYGSDNRDTTSRMPASGISETRGIATETVSAPTETVRPDTSGTTSNAGVAARIATGQQSVVVTPTPPEKLPSRTSL